MATYNQNPKKSKGKTYTKTKPRKKAKKMTGAGPRRDKKLRNLEKKALRMK